MLILSWPKIYRFNPKIQTEKLSDKAVSQKNRKKCTIMLGCARLRTCAFYFGNENCTTGRLRLYFSKKHLFATFFYEKRLLLGEIRHLREKPSLTWWSRCITLSIVVLLNLQMNELFRIHNKVPQEFDFVRKIVANIFAKDFLKILSHKLIDKLELFFCHWCVFRNLFE